MEMALTPSLFGVYLDADDVALFATFAHSLQAKVSSVHAYATKWGLSVNISWSKVLVFTGVGSLSQCVPH